MLVVIVSTDDADWLPDCLQSLSESTETQFEVLLVANACRDETVEIARASAVRDRLAIVQLPNRCGFAEASNVGLARARDLELEYVFLLNPDTRVHPCTLSLLRRFLDEQPAYGIAGARQIKYEADNWETNNAWTTETLQHAASLGERPKPVGTWSVLDHEYVQGAAMMFRVSLLSELGYLDPVYGSFYEETDFCRRCWLSRRKVGLLMDSVIKHYGGGGWRASIQSHLQRDVTFLSNQLLYLISAESTLPLAIRVGARLVARQLVGLSRHEEETLLPFWQYPKVLARFATRLKYLPAMQRRNSSLRSGKPLSRSEFTIGDSINKPLVTVINSIGRPRA